MVSVVAGTKMRSNCLQGVRGGTPPPKPDQPWMDFDESRHRNKDQTAVAATKQPERILPKVIMYDQDTGIPINAQDVRAATGQEAKIATVPWAEWLRGRIAHALCEKTNHKAAIQLVLNALHTRGRIDQTPIDTIVDLNSKRKVVKASEDLPTGTLALPPCVPHTSRVYDKSTHPHRVPILVMEKSAVADVRLEVRKGTKVPPPEPKRSVYYIHPEYKCPEESTEERDEAVEPHVRAWEFKGDETMHPFWAVERLTEDDRRKALKGAFNLACEDKEFAAVSVDALGENSIASTFAVVVPIMTNTVAVKKGEELILENTFRKETKRKDGSWKTDLAKAEKARKARAKANTAARSLEVVTEI